MKNRTPISDYYAFKQRTKNGYSKNHQEAEKHHEVFEKRRGDENYGYRSRNYWEKDLVVDGSDYRLV